MNVSESFRKLEAQRRKLPSKAAQPDVWRTNPQNVSVAFAAEESRRKQLKNKVVPLSNLTGTLFVATTFLLLLFSGLLPIFPVLIFLSIWTGVLFCKGFRLFVLTREMFWLFSVPLLALCSALWSTYPTKTLYLSLALFSTFICTWIINKTVRFSSFINGVVLATVIALLITLLSGKYGTDIMSGTYSLIGYFGSKNTVGLIASIGLLMTASLFFSRRSLLFKMCASIGPFILCAVCLYLSRSATSLVSVIVAYGVMAFMALLSLLPKLMRSWMLSASLIICIVSVPVGLLLGGNEMIPRLVGKDSTMTGRTVLWKDGYRIGWEQPFLGHGYSAFWVPGEPRAEKLWYQFQIYGRQGFHFHDMYIQAFVDLGIIGTLLVALHFVVNCIKSMRLIKRNKFTQESILLAGLSYLFLVRSYVEVDVIGTFSAASIIFYSINLRINEIYRDQNIDSARI